MGGSLPPPNPQQHSPIAWSRGVIPLASQRLAPPPSVAHRPHLSDLQGLWQHRQHTQLCPREDGFRRDQLAEFYNSILLDPLRLCPFQYFHSPLSLSPSFGFSKKDFSGCPGTYRALGLQACATRPIL